jgi:ribosomal protein S18 acetylase RimI-like enzyme
MSFQVREARAGDEASIVSLIQELAAAGGETSPVSEEYVTAYLSSPGVQVLLAEEKERVVGLLSFSVRLDLYHGAPSGMIEELVVRAGDRGRGVGSALVSDVLRRLEALGCAEVSVTTMPDNEAAQRFYRSHGLVDEAVFLEKHF